MRPEYFDPRHDRSGPNRYQRSHAGWPVLPIAVVWQLVSEASPVSTNRALSEVVVFRKNVTASSRGIGKTPKLQSAVLPASLRPPFTVSGLTRMANGTHEPSERHPNRHCNHPSASSHRRQIPPFQFQATKAHRPHIPNAIWSQRPQTLGHPFMLSASCPYRATETKTATSTSSC